MKPFDLQKAIAGHPLVTRDGREVTEFHYFKTANKEFRCMAVIGGRVENFYENGIWIPNTENNNDLFLKSEKKKLFIRVSDKKSENSCGYRASDAYESKELLAGVCDGWQTVEVEIDT